MLPLLIGQCYGAMKNKIESNESFDNVKNVYDVWGLLHLIKKFSYAMKKPSMSIGLWSMRLRM